MVWVFLVGALSGVVSLFTAVESVVEGRHGLPFLIWHGLWALVAIVGLIWVMPGGFL